MARKALFDIATADNGRRAISLSQTNSDPQVPQLTSSDGSQSSQPARRRQEYREGKRAVMFFLPEEAFSEMHVLLARQGRKKVQQLMEELVDDWFRRESAPRLIK